MRRFLLVLSLGLFLPGATQPLAAQQEITCRWVLTAADVSNLFKAGVPEARVKDFITTCKVGFRLSKEQEKKFRGLGASSDLILAILRNYEAIPNYVPERTIKDHKSIVWSVTFSPDGKLLASGGRDMTIKLWDVSTGRELRTLSGHKSVVWSVAFSPDGKLLVSGSSDKTIKLWNPTTGRYLRPSEATRVKYYPSPSARTGSCSPSAASIGPSSSGAALISDRWPTTGDQCC